MQTRLEKFWLVNEWKCYFWLLTVVALLMRLSLLPFESGDMRVFLIPWLDFLRANSGFLALSQEFSNYNPPYLYLLALVSYLPAWVPAVTCIKIIGIPFDFLSAFYVAKILQVCGKSLKLQILAYFAVLFLPTVLINSSIWGQCDGIYSSFLVLCVYYLCRNLPARAMLFFGIALSFKLQALFFGPAFFALFLARKIRFKHFFIIPAVYVCSLLPAFAFGRDIKSLFSVYISQAGFYKNLSLNAPNLYLWLSDGDPNKQIADTYYNLLTPAGYILAISFVFFLGFSVLNKKRELNAELIVAVHFVSALVTPFLLPKMHDRYFYLADVFSAVFAFCNPTFFFIPILMQLASLSVYLNVLFASTLLEPETAALVVTLIICLLMKYFLKTIWSEKLLENEVTASSDIAAQEATPFCFTEKNLIIFFSLYLVLLALHVPIPSFSSTASSLYLKIESEQGQELGSLQAITSIQDWGQAKYGSDLNGNPLVVGGIKYDNTICVHASSLVSFDLSDKFKTFSALAALPDYLLKEKVDANVRFKVLGDGALLWDSGPMRSLGSLAKVQPFIVDVSSVESLSLIVEPSSSSIKAAHACWAMPSLIK